MFDPKETQEQVNGPFGGRLSRYAVYLYLAMALLIVGVATAIIFALSRSTDQLPSYSTPEFSFGEILPPENSRPQVIIPLPPEESEEQPVFGENSGVTEDTSSESPVINEEPSYVLPVEGGEVQKECALDKLVFSQTMQDYRTHAGIDITAELGDPVLCYAPGVVESVKEDPLLGVTVTVKHEYGLVTVYANLDANLALGITPGKQLATGQVLGYVGNTALSEKAERPHLHFEMLLNGAHIDPENELY